MYEICKGIKDKDSNKICSAVVWTDLRVYANKIADSLSILDGCDYIVKHVDDIGIFAIKKIKIESTRRNM